MTNSPATIIYFSSLKNTPIGEVWIAGSERGLVAVEWAEKRADLLAYLKRRLKFPVEENPKKVTNIAEQLYEYLEGKRQKFDFSIDWSFMRPFQRKALLATYEIPYGQTSTYGEIAESIGHPRAARAIGRAEATNPMPLVIPCHRVLGADGKLRGYGGGLDIKKWLLKMEGAVLV